MSSKSYGSLKIDENGIFELPLTTNNGVKKENIEKIILIKKVPAKNPYVNIFFGIVFSILGMAGLTPIYLWIFRGQPLVLNEIFALLIFLIIGLWMLIFGLVKKHIVIINPGKNEKKIVMHSNPAPDELKKFISTQCEIFGYKFIDN